MLNNLYGNRQLCNLKAIVRKVYYKKLIIKLSGLFSHQLF